MNYTYDITVNFNRDLINFYEWNQTDSITKIRKTIVFEVDKKTYKDILNKSVKVDKKFIDKLYPTNYTCIFTTEVDAVCVKFDNDGCINLISKLLLEEEKNILDELTQENKIKLKYKKIPNNQNKFSYYTRNEKQKIDRILSFLAKEKDNTSLMEYMYYEWFNTMKSKDKYSELSSAINKEYTEKHDRLLKIIDLLSYNNV